ncbi:hypothetical protein [Marinibacterium profundimaris]|uniref:Lysozyme inhibitor LprI N-terminal domain-containing protein n=1 Tax=Marinibacterium profundimaris TaxID=1679460 RepID=A0A225NYY6_9RHOB|nr:hypothetical protein [Marinibacterium profundimaris]OWU77346.1 hypothetical protein ATO3_01065 [Marinibacterium profundimaris]
MRAHPIRTGPRIAVLALALLAGPALAQDPSAASGETSLQGLGERAAPTAAQDDGLAACIANRDRLARFTTDLSARLADTQAGCAARVTEETEPLTRALSICEEEVDQHQRTNITLNDRLLACETAPRTDPDRIAALEAEVARLTERLANAGLGAEPGYGYAGGSVWSSFVAGDELDRVQGSLPRLPVEDCPAALDWLAAQDGADRAVRTEVWVWDGETPQICRRGADETPGLAPARPQDEAHVVIFR